MSTLKRVSNRHLRRKIVNNTKLALSGLIDTVTLQNNTDNFCITSHPINPIYNLNENNEGRSEYSPLSENLIENNSLNYFVLRQRRHEYSQLKVDKAREDNFLETNKIGKDSWETNFLSALRNWAMENNVTHKCINDLIPLIKDRYPFLPNDARTILGTPTSNQTIKLHNGEMIYFGLANELSEKLKYGYVVSDLSPNNNDRPIVRLEVNVDGIPIYNSSSLEFWPILVRSKNLKNQTPFAVAIFCGRGKPDTIEMFLKEFVDECSIIFKNGIVSSNNEYGIEISFFTCDAPARAFLKQIKGHTSTFGCERCKIRSEYADKRRFYPSGVDFEQRKDVDFEADINDDSHIKGRSPLSHLKLGLVSMFVLDPMHLIFLGVMKRLLLLYWLEGKRPVKLSKSVVAKIDNHIKLMKKYITNDFSRKMRCLKDIKRWKATEFRFFLLYFGPVLLRSSVINNNFYKHFLLLHSSIFILSNENLVKKYIEIAKSSLIKFVKEGSEIYGKHFNVYNVHSLIHICEDVQLYGNLNKYSCFPFENYLGRLKRLIRGKNRPLQQINNRLKELLNNKVLSLDENINFKPFRIFDKNSNYFQCSKLQINNKMIISTSIPDNVVAVKRKIYIIKSIICIDDVYKCVARKFRYQENCYKYPLESSKLGIYYAWGEGDQGFIEISDISSKYISFPFKKGFYCVPILHH